MGPNEDSRLWNNTYPNSTPVSKEEQDSSYEESSSAKNLRQNTLRRVEHAECDERDRL